MQRTTAILTVLLFAAAVGRAQTNRQLTLDPWSQGSFGETNDRILFQSEADVKGEDANAQVFFWDFDRALRFDKNDPKSPAIAYRWVTMNFDTNSDRVPGHLDDMSAAVGLHVGKLADGDVSLVLGAGWSGNNPFDDATGLYGIGHAIWRKPLNATDAFVLSVDFNGNSSFLRNIPLPGFGFEHREKTFSFGAGFPDSWVQWTIAPNLDLTARYGVPYTADAMLEYHFTDRFSAFGGASNFFNGYSLDDRPSTDHLFFNMSRVEGGIRYRDPNFWKKFYVDASLVIGYAFEQNFYRGFDVRNLDSFSSISDEPYIGIVILGRL